MLVLTRSRGQGIRCGGPCRVMVVSVDQGKVRLGIEADREVTIHRDEVQSRIEEESGPLPDSLAQVLQRGGMVVATCDKCQRPFASSQLMTNTRCVECDECTGVCR